jgi:hypothetical protein
MTRLKPRRREVAGGLMNPEKVLKLVECSLREGADLPLKVAQECGHAIV